MQKGKKYKNKEKRGNVYEKEKVKKVQKKRKKVNNKNRKKLIKRRKKYELQIRTIKTKTKR